MFRDLKGDVELMRSEMKDIKKTTTSTDEKNSI